MSKQPTRRRRARCAVARILVVEVGVAALVATLGAGPALAIPDERVLERQGRVNHELSAGQAGEQGKTALPPQLSGEDKAAFRQAQRERSQQKATQFPRRYLRPAPPMDTGPRLDIDEPVAPAPAPPAQDRDRDGLAITLAVVAVLLALGAAATWRIHYRRPRPEPTA